MFSNRKIRETTKYLSKTVDFDRKQVLYEKKMICYIVMLLELVSGQNKNITLRFIRKSGAQLQRKVKKNDKKWVNKQIVSSNEQKVAGNKQKITSNEKKVASNEQKVIGKEPKK